MLTGIREQVKTLLADSYISDPEVDTLIRRGEQKIERDMVADGQYKPRQMYASVTEELTGVFGITVPSDFIRVRSLQVGGNRLRYASPEKVDLLTETTDINYTLYYYKRTPRLNDTEDNWLEAIADDLYVYAAALAYTPHMKDDPRLNMWGTFYSDVLNSTCRSNAPQPTGGWQQWKGRPYKGLYTIEGDLIRLA